jgi:hypothetical protein
MRLERYCTCGAVLRVNIAARKKAQTLIVWYDRHSGDGHADTDAAGAEAARMGTSAGMGRETARREAMGR